MMTFATTFITHNIKVLRKVCQTQQLITLIQIQSNSLMLLVKDFFLSNLESFRV